MNREDIAIAIDRARWRGEEDRAHLRAEYLERIERILRETIPGRTNVGARAAIRRGARRGGDPAAVARSIAWAPGRGPGAALDALVAEWGYGY